MPILLRMLRKKLQFYKKFHTKNHEDIIVLNIGTSHHLHQFIPGPNKFSVKVYRLDQEQTHLS